MCFTLYSLCSQFQLNPLPKSYVCACLCSHSHKCSVTLFGTLKKPNFPPARSSAVLHGLLLTLSLSKEWTLAKTHVTNGKANLILPFEH